MKKLIIFAAIFAVSAVFAQDSEGVSETTGDASTVEISAPRKNIAVWPAFFAISEIPATPDLVGFRLTFPFSTKQESVTGFDVGLWARTRVFEGIAINLLRNDVKDQLTGFQIGLYNSAVQADSLGLQVGLWNEAGTLWGVQAGVVNTVGAMEGIQVGVINRAEELYGFQVGVINIIRDAEFRFLPLVNIGF